MLVYSNDAVRRRSKELEEVIHSYFSQPVLAAADDPTGGLLYDHDAFVAGLAAECERAMSQMIADELAEMAASAGDHATQDSLFQAAYSALRPDPAFVIDEIEIQSEGKDAKHDS